jgi:hypothetical protein
VRNSTFVVQTILPMRSPHASSRFRQQQLHACRIFLTPLSTAILYAIMSIISFGVGAAYTSATGDLLHLEFNYTEGTANFDLTLSKNYSGPFYVYYALNHFYQNHFLYSESKNWEQLEGDAYSKDADLDSCVPVIRNASDSFFVPCGAVSLSVFNDSFTFSSNFPSIEFSEIALPQFRDVFRPANIVYQASDDWLNETLFPGKQINERFINWHRIAAMPSFPKLWGKTTDKVVLIADVNYTIEIENHFPVSQFEGEKWLVIAQTTWLGGQNRYYGPFFFGLGSISAITSIVFVWFTWFKKARVPQSRRLSMSSPLLEN